MSIVRKASTTLLVGHKYGMPMMLLQGVLCKIYLTGFPFYVRVGHLLAISPSHIKILLLWANIETLFQGLGILY